MSESNFFKVASRYRHRDCLDVDIVVTYIHKVGYYGSDIDVLYYNRNYNDLAQGGTEQVFIKKEDYPNWSLVEENFI
jgi:hypothetical protein